MRDVSIYNSLGWLYLTSGNYKSAQQLLSKAAGYEPQNSRETNARIFNNLGLAYFYAGDYKPAATAFGKAAEFGSDTAASNLQLLSAAQKKAIVIK